MKTKHRLKEIQKSTHQSATKPFGKKLLSLVLCVCMLTTMLLALPISVFAASSGTCGENATWSYENGTLTISGTGTVYYVYGSERLDELTIKSIVINPGITEVANSALCDMEYVENISLPNTLRLIGPYAFGGLVNLKNINLPNGLEKIGGYSFSGCTSLSTVSISGSVTYIASDAFDGCANIKEFIVDSSNKNYSALNGDLYSKGRTELLRYAGGKSDTSFNISKNIYSIDDYAFDYSNNLSCISVDVDNPYYTSVNGNLYYKGTEVEPIALVRYAMGKNNQSFTIPKWVQKIGVTAFSGSGNLTNIVIPDGIQEIGVTSDNNGNWNEYCIEWCESLSSVTIPDSVTKIGDDAFRGCSRLKDVNIHNGVTSIGNDAFWGCYSLESITIPDGVTSIGVAAFGLCRNLTSVTIPDSVTEIDAYAFSRCYGLESITIPDSVISIRECTFEYCRNLTSVTIPDSVTSIDSSAFEDCDWLKDVYYSGSQEQWEKISINSGNDCLTNATIHYNGVIYTEPVYANPSNVTGGFSFASGNGNASFNYSDLYFRNSSYTYNHSLAQMSMRLALSAFASHSNGYRNQDKNVRDLMEKLNFRDFYKNEWYDKAPTKNSVGVAIARKWIAMPNADYSASDNCTILAVAIRGGGYENEWGGNFNVGSDTEHAGFAAAREQVIDAVKKYQKKYAVTGKVKVWITGYSRAAATANLVAAYLDKSSGSGEFGFDYSPGDIYAYCFEPPAPTSDSQRGNSLYKNIFSIVNQHDFVPMVVMNKWNYGRYGVTKYLPSAQTNKNYKYMITDVRTKFKTYSGKNYVVDDFAYYYPTTSWITKTEKGLFNGQGVYLERTMDKLANAVGSPLRYKNNFQEVFEYIGENVIGKGNINELADSMISEFKKNKVLIAAEGVLSMNPAYTWTRVGSVYYTIRKSVKNAFGNIGVYISNSAVDSIVGLIFDIGIDGVYTLFMNTAGIEQAHFPELCMAWLDTMNESDFTNKRLRTLYLNCPVDMVVCDSTGRAVAKIENDIPVSIDGSTITTYVDENGQKIVYLPENENYMINVTATDSGNVTYSMQESSSETDTVKIINYNNIQVNKGDVLTGTAENLSEEEQADYTLKANETELDASEQIDEATPFKVALQADGGGNVSGEGTYYKGEYAKVYAVPSTDTEEFVGWYNGDSLVSSESEYRFAVNSDTTLTAKFTDNTIEINFVDEDDLIFTQRISKGETAQIPEAPKKKYYKFEGYYMDSEYTQPVDETTVYNENTTVYAKYTELEKKLEHGFYYYITEDGNAEIVGYEPSQIGQYPIVPFSFEGHDLTRIGDKAFSDAPISEIWLPDTLTEIGADVFENCAFLTINYAGSKQQWDNIKIAESNEAFDTAKINYDRTEYVMDANVEDMSYTDPNLTVKINIIECNKDCCIVADIYDENRELYITKEIGCINKGTTGEQSFEIPFKADDERHLIKIKFTDTETKTKEYGDTIGEMFYAERKKYTSADGLYEYALAGNDAEITDYLGSGTDLVIPDTIDGHKVIGLCSYAIDGRNENIKSITLPSALEYMEECAISYADITEISLPASVRELEPTAFGWCEYLCDIKVDEQNENYCSIDGNLYSKDKKTLVQYAIGKTDEKFEIPSYVENIADYALDSAGNIRDIKIPNSVKRIGVSALRTSAEQIYVPASVETIGIDAFCGCDELEGIIVDEDNPNYSDIDGVLFDKSGETFLQYPNGRAGTFYEIPDGTKKISRKAIVEADKLKTIILPASVTEIDVHSVIIAYRSLEMVLFRGGESEWDALAAADVWNECALFKADRTVINYDLEYNEFASVAAKIESCEYYEDTQELGVDIKFLYSFESCAVMLAVYDSDNRLVAVDTKYAAETDGRCWFTIPSVQNLEGYTVKAFFCDVETGLKPLSGTAISTVK